MEKSNLTRFDRWKIHYIPHGEQRLTKYDYEEQEYYLDCKEYKNIDEYALVQKLGMAEDKVEHLKQSLKKVREKYGIDS